MIGSHRPVAEFPATDDERSVAPVLASIEDGRVVLDRDDAGRLVGLLASDRKTLRRLAAGALATALKDGDLEADFAEDLLAHPLPAIRWGAAFAMARAGIGGARVLAAAIAALASDDGDVRWAASSMLVAAAKRDAGMADTLRALARGGAAVERKMALLTLAEAGRCDADTACRALADDDALVRIAAITALGRASEASGAVLEALASVAGRDADEAVRRSATAVRQRLQHPSPARRFR